MQLYRCNNEAYFNKNIIFKTVQKSVSISLLFIDHTILYYLSTILPLVVRSWLVLFFKKSIKIGGFQRGGFDQTWKRQARLDPKEFYPKKCVNFDKSVFATKQRKSILQQV